VAIVAGLPDEEVARLIHQDHIDVLVDLTGHTGGNRLPLFARQAAPLQISYLGSAHGEVDPPAGVFHLLSATGGCTRCVIASRGCYGLGSARGDIFGVHFGNGFWVSFAPDDLAVSNVAATSLTLTAGDRTLNATVGVAL